MQNAVEQEVFTHSFYAVRIDEHKFFAGFDAENSQTRIVPSHETAKWFSDRNTIRLRPNETLVEIKVDPRKGVVSVSEPFRPRKRQPNTNAVKMK